MTKTFPYTAQRVRHWVTENDQWPKFIDFVRYFTKLAASDAQVQSELRQVRLDEASMVRKFFDYAKNFYAKHFRKQN